VTDPTKTKPARRICPDNTFSETPALWTTVDTGPPEDQSTYHNEVSSITAGIQATNWLALIYHVHQGSATFGCDGLQAVWHSFQTIHFEPKQAQFDLLLATQDIRKEGTTTWTWRHIKGHQNKHISWKQLDWRAWRNVQMDASGKRHHCRVQGRPPPNPWFHSKPYWALWRSNVKQSKVDMHQILEDLCGPDLLA
jgi:hypothetical protein